MSRNFHFSFMSSGLVASTGLFFYFVLCSEAQKPLYFGKERPRTPLFLFSRYLSFWDCLPHDFVSWLPSRKYLTPRSNIEIFFCQGSSVKTGLTGKPPDRGPFKHSSKLRPGRRPQGPSQFYAAPPSVLYSRPYLQSRERICI